MAVTKISAIQGASATSSIVGQTVTVEAVVVGDFQNGDADTSRDLGGFFIQEEFADEDGLSTTSEGLFISQSTLGTDVAVGQLVRVTGVVSEDFGLTQLKNVEVTILGAGDDTLTGGLGNDLLKGGEGDDVATYAGPRAAYTVVRGLDGQVLVSARRAPILWRVWNGCGSSTPRSWSPSLSTARRSAWPTRGRRSRMGGRSPWRFWPMTPIPTAMC